MIPTDVACATDGSPGLAFMRLDRGDHPADHHSVVLLQGNGEGYLHSAFEVFDLDSIGQAAGSECIEQLAAPVLIVSQGLDGGRCLFLGIAVAIAVAIAIG